MPKHNLEMLYEKQVELIKNDVIPVEIVLKSLYETQELILKHLEDVKNLPFSDLRYMICNAYALSLVDMMYNYLKIIKKNKNNC